MVMDNSPRPRGAPSSAASSDAFRSFFDQTYGPATSYLRRRLRGDASYEDVAADAYTVVWRRWDDRPANPNEWMPWMYGICRNVLRNHHRSTSRRLRLLRKVELDESTAHQGGDDVDVALHEAMGRLAAADREVLLLINWEGLSHGEVGQVLGCSPNAVAIRAHRARRQLAERLGRPTERSVQTVDMNGSNRTLPCELNPLENPA
jgi:RNA polymerase sigma-70 factor (ECF subfamily)